MTNLSSVTLAAKDGPWAQIRTGTIVSASGATAVVLVGATSFEASVLVPFGTADPTAATPLPGTLVAVARQDSSWIVLGQILGASGNLILNGSFEDSPAGEPPVDWILYEIANTSAVVVTTDTTPVAGSNVAAVSTVSAVAATSFLYSSPVQVAAGETMQLSAFVGAQYDETVAETADSALYALWFANDTNLYPTTSSADTLVASVTDVVPSPPWSPMSGQVVAPVTGFMRLGLRSSITEGQTLLYDFASVRRFTV